MLRYRGYKGDCLKKACFYRKILISFKNKKIPKALVCFMRLSNFFFFCLVQKLGKCREAWNICEVTEGRDFHHRKAVSGHCPNICIAAQR